MSAAAGELAALDLIGQGALVRADEVTPRELVEAAIGRIEAVNPRLNAVIATLYDAALAEADRLGTHRALPDGPLAGTPFLVKDLGAAMAGVPDTWGSRALLGNVPKRDSPLVTRYRDAGLVIVGRTNTPEFGNHSTTEPELHGPTRNPWDPTRTVGGSSGGSAAAVASGMVPAAHGGDGAGSLRIPASCCGVFGFKPSRGRVSNAPGDGGTAGLAVRHAITRSVRDNAALLDIGAGPLPGDLYTAPAPARPYLEEVGRDPGRLRIGWTATPPIDVPVDADCVAAVRAAADLLAGLGHEVDEASPAFDGSVLVGPLGTVWAINNTEDVRFCEAVLGRPPRDDELEITTRELADFGRTRSALDLVDATTAFASATRQFARFFDDHDIWLTPTLARRPEKLGVLNQSVGGALEWQHFDDSFNPWNPIANIAGAPAMSVPLHWTADGLPIGVLLTGRYGDEGTLFRLAAQLEAARPWANRRPPISAPTAA
ncbi:MAG TPA: amidase [Candidatus Limnocylindrales bacterium]|nr:amidase [Candidatus Limnocylindrales bacterium]